MNNKETNQDNDGISRRTVLRGAGAAVLAAGAPKALANIAGPTVPPTTPPTSDPDDIYKLMALWIALSTNSQFATFSPQIIGQIQAETGASADIVCQAVAIVKQEKSAYLGVRAMFDEISALFLYPPSQCPYFLSTLRPFATMKPVKPAPAANGTPIDCSNLTPARAK